MTAATNLTVVPDATNVVELLSRVMADVQAVRKGDVHRSNVATFNFRGVDSVVNAVGPALRTHGVVVVPVGVEQHFESYQSKNGAQMRNAVLAITWRFYGPAGDFIEAQTLGEASDAGDKSVPKAHSVAYRTLLLQALCIPTDEPDPDASAHERSAPSVAAEPLPFEAADKWLTRIDQADTVAALDAVVDESKPFRFSEPDKATLGAAVTARRQELTGTLT